MELVVNLFNFSGGEMGGIGLKTKRREWLHASQGIQPQPQKHSFVCPFCGQGVEMKKGVLPEHFLDNGERCRGGGKEVEV